MMTIPGTPSALIRAARDRKHRPLSHPLMAARMPDERDYYVHIARRIRMLREEHGLTQRQLAAKLGVSSVTVCHWERGQTRPTAWNIDRLERTFAVSVRP